MLGERKVPRHAVLGDDPGPFRDDLDGVVAVVVEEVVDAARELPGDFGGIAQDVQRDYDRVDCFERLVAVGVHDVFQDDVEGLVEIAG